MTSTIDFAVLAEICSYFSELAGDGLPQLLDAFGQPVDGPIQGSATGSLCNLLGRGYYLGECRVVRRCIGQGLDSRTTVVPAFAKTLPGRIRNMRVIILMPCRERFRKMCIGLVEVFELRGKGRVLLPCSGLSGTIDAFANYVDLLDSVGNPVAKRLGRLSIAGLPPRGGHRGEWVLTQFIRGTDIAVGVVVIAAHKRTE